MNNLQPIRLCYFLCRQKVTKNLVILEGDFCARGSHKTTDKVETNAQIHASSTLPLSLPGITKKLIIVPALFTIYTGLYGEMWASVKIRAGG